MRKPWAWAMVNVGLWTLLLLAVAVVVGFWALAGYSHNWIGHY